jgi:hypothetical protein
MNLEEEAFTSRKAFERSSIVNTKRLSFCCFLSFTTGAGLALQCLYIIDNFYYSGAYINAFSFWENLA